MSFMSRLTTRLRWALPAVAAAVIVGACDIDVADPDVVQEEELSGPAAVPTAINGLIGDLANATEHYALYTGMFTDEMILAGTFPTRVQVDERRVLPSNATTTGEVNEGVQTARRQAESLVSNFEGSLGEEGFDDAQLRRGIAFGQYVEALMELQLGELYCQIPIEPGGSAIPSAEIVQTALSEFQEAEAAAEEAGLGEWADAARLGQARANLYLGNFDQAASVASGVDRSHRLEVEFDTNSPAQFNKYFDLTFGSQNQVIRWTVGDGGQSERGNEKFAEYDEFVDLGIIQPESDLEAFNSSIAVHLQLIYDEPADNILISNGLHARLIEAEAAIRNGNTGAAEDMINDVREDWDERWAAHRFSGVSELSDVTLSGDMRQDLRTLMGEYARETWLTGTRQENLRRLVEEFGAGSDMDLFPEREGDQICWPVPEQEETGASPS